MSERSEFENANLSPRTAATAATSVVQTVPIYSWYVLGLLILTYMLAALDRSIVSVIVEPIRAEFNLNDSELGFLVGLAFGIPCGIASLPVGLIIDRVNRCNFLSAVLALWSMLTALGGFAQSYMQLVISRMAVGAAESGIPTAHALITDYFPAEKRPMALGFLLSGGTIAYMIIFALGGWVVQNWGWRYVFFVVGLPGIAIAVLIFLTVREPQRGATERNPHLGAEPAPSLPETLRHLFSLRSFRHLFVGYALVNASMATFWSWIGSLLIRVHGLPVHEAGLFIAVGPSVCAFLGAILGAALAGRLGARGIKPVLIFLAVGAAAAAPFGITMSLVPSLTVTLACMAVVGAIKPSYLGPTQGVMLTLAKVRMRGATSGLINVLGTLVAFGVGPLLAGVISHVLGGGGSIRYGLATLFILDAWGAVHFWLARRTLEADLRTAAD